MRVLIVAAIATVLGVAPALAQAQAKPEELEKRRKAQELDKGYQDALKRQQAAPAAVANDPWAMVRPMDAPAKTDGKTDGKTRR